MSGVSRRRSSVVGRRSSSVFNVTEGEYYWLADPDDCYIPARLVSKGTDSTSGCEFTMYPNNKKTLKRPITDVVQPVLPPLTSLGEMQPDLVDSHDVSEAYLLWNIRNKFMVGSIYSSIGSIIIALNPYAQLPDLYNEKIMTFFLGEGHEKLDKIPPHVWGTTRKAYDNLIKEGKRQAMIISGESGSGKTETAKKCLELLSRLSSEGKSNDDEAIEAKVLRSNPLLESFGNCKTLRNNNSSRFGKWLEIDFEKEGHDKLVLLGANITQYLLEKSRVVSQAKNERSYHIFYQLCAHEFAGVGKPSEYKYLSQSGCYTIPGVNDKEDFNETIAAFDTLKFSTEKKTAVLNTLAAILNIGNIKFVPMEEDDDCISQDASVSPKSKPFLEKAAELLGLNAEDFAAGLCARPSVIQGRNEKVPFNINQAEELKNAVAKEMYGRVFSFIIHTINETLAGPHRDLESSIDSQTSPTSIGLLDIFGFEILTTNSLEQLAINYTNEKLQNHFVNDVMFKELSLYKSEEIEFTQENPNSNDEIIQLIGRDSKTKGKTNMFSLLDDDSRQSRVISDISWLNNVQKTQPKSDQSTIFFKDVKLKKTQFKIRHFAGEVLYDCTGFVEKNKDKLYEHMDDMLIASSDSMLADIFLRGSPRTLFGTSQSSAASGGKKIITLMGRLDSQLNELMNVLETSDPHFIKCIKPNGVKSPGKVDSRMVLEQLRYSGTLEAVMIRKSGYPIRKTHQEFKGDYWAIAGLTVAELRSEDNLTLCNKIVNIFKSRDAKYQRIQVGKTIVFFTPKIISELAADRAVIESKLIQFVQKTYRMHLAIIYTKKLKKARDELRVAIKKGSENNEGNVEMIDDIQRKINYVRDDLSLRIKEISDGEKLLRRLREVNACFEKLTSALQSMNVVTDVVAEYENATSILQNLDTLGVHNERRKDLENFIVTLKERAEYLILIRKSIKSRDQVQIEIALEEGNNLKAKYGEFCEEEMNTCKKLLTEIRREFEILDALIVTVFNLSKIDMNDQNDSSVKAAIQASQNEASKQLDDLKKDYIGKSPCSNHVYTIVSTIYSIKYGYIHGEWDNVLSLSRTLVINANIVRSILSAEGDSSMPTPYTNRLQTLLPLIEPELQFAETSVDLNITLPMYAKAFDEAGAVDLCQDHDATAHCAYMRMCLKEVDAVGIYSCHIKDIKSSFERLVQMLDAVVNKNYNMALALAEDAMETKIRRDLYGKFTSLCVVDDDELDEDLRIFKKGFPDDSEVAATNPLDNISYDNAKNLAYSKVMVKIQSDISQCRKKAIAEYMANLHIEAFTHNRMKGPLGSNQRESIDLVTLKQVKKDCEKLEFYSFVDNLPSFKRAARIIQLVTKIGELREMYSTGSWEQIVDFYKSLDYTTVVGSAKQLEEQTPLFSAFVVTELNIIISEGRNFYIKEELFGELEVGAISGAIGNIKMAQINTRSLSRISNLITECKTIEPVGVLPELESLLTFINILTEVRKAFIHAEYAEIDASVPLLDDVNVPDICSEEVELIKSEYNYLKTLHLIENALKTDPDCKYFEYHQSIEIEMEEPEHVLLHEKCLSLESEMYSLKQLLEMVRTLQFHFNGSLTDEEKETNKAFERCKHAANALELIIGVRTAIKAHDFHEAVQWYEKMPLTTLGSFAVHVEVEVNNNADMIYDAMHIELMKEAICSGEATGAIGQIDLRHSVQLTPLSDALTSAQRRNSKNTRVNLLLEAALSVQKLRQSIRVHDWSGVRNLINDCEKKPNADVLIPLFQPEFDRACVEVSNIELLRNLCSILEEERIEGDPSVLSDHSSCLKLTDFIISMKELDDMKRYSDLTKALLKLTPTLHRLREASLSAFETVENFEEELRNYSPLLDNLHQVYMECLDNSDSLGSPSSDDLQSMKILIGHLSDERQLMSFNYRHSNLEAAFMDALKAFSKKPYLTEDSIGRVDKKLVDTEALALACEMKSTLYEEGCTLSPSFKRISKIGKLILDIRLLILADDWSKIQELLSGQTTSIDDPSLPDAVRSEIHVLTLEMETITVVNGIKEAVDEGKLYLRDEEEDNLEFIVQNTDFSSLAQFTRKAMSEKGVIPKSQKTKDMIDSAETIVSLRKDLKKCVEEGAPPYDWRKLQSRVESIIKAPDSGKQSSETYVHKDLIAEVIEFQKLAYDQILFTDLQDVLKDGGPVGPPGNLNVNCIETEKFNVIARRSAHAKLKQTKELLDMSYIVFNIRDNLRRTSETNRMVVRDAWNMINANIEEAFKKSETNIYHTGYDECKDELLLVAQECQIREVRKKILESIENTKRIYLRLNKSFHHYSKDKSIRGSILQLEGDQLSTNDLNQIVFLAEKPDLTSKVLHDLTDCCKSMRRIRNCVISRDWTILHELSVNPSILADLEKFPESKVELELAMREAHNSNVVESLEACLKNKAENDNDGVRLREAITFAKSEVEILDERTRQLLEISQHILKLRIAMAQSDHIKTSAAIHWFESTTYFRNNTSLKYIVDEFEQAKQKHSNDTVIADLLKALENGKAQGWVGNLNFRAIKTEELSKAIERGKILQAQENGPTEEMNNILETAINIFELRCAQKLGDIAEVSIILEKLKQKDKLHTSIIQEVAAARSEVDNYKVIVELIKSIKSFDPSPARVIEEIAFDEVDVVGENVVKMPIDDSIFLLEPISKALKEVNELGIFSRDAKRLHKTAVIVEFLRQAKKDRDWDRVDEILMDVAMEQNSKEERLDPIVDEEINVSALQLEVRDSLAKIMKSLKSGWARCSNGIVDQSTIESSSLVAHTERLENCFIDAYGGDFVINEIEMQKTTNNLKETSLSVDISTTSANSSFSSSLNSSKSPRKGRRRDSMHMSVGAKAKAIDSLSLKSKEGVSKRDLIMKACFGLLKSAKKVYYVRQLISHGDLEMASTVALEAAEDPDIHPVVLGELRLYSFEIGNALHIVKLSRDLKEFMRKRRPDALLECLFSVRNEDIRDLGLLCVVEKALNVYIECSKKQAELFQIRSNYDVEKIQDLIDGYEADELPQSIIEFSRNRSTRLSKLSLAIEDIKKSSFGFIHGNRWNKYITDVAQELALVDHPYIRRVRLINKMADHTKTIASIIGAVASGCANASASYTMQLRSSYFKAAIEKHGENVLLESYKNWRPLSEFHLFSVVEKDPEEQKQIMLTYSKQSIPTSLTVIPPQLSALAVWIFSHNVCAIERDISSHPQILLRDMIILGRRCISMRDEILSQHLKQIRKNPDQEGRTRIYKSLMACLYHFPPSESFERYIEGVMIIEHNNNPTDDYYGRLVLRCMHEGIFKYGYHQKLSKKFDDSPATMQKWLNSSELLDKISTDHAHALQNIIIDHSMIRGSRENWKQRFASWCRMSETSTNTMNLTEFTKVFKKVTESRNNGDIQWDVKDKEILSLLILGRWPKRAVSISREYDGDMMVFLYKDDQEENISIARRIQMKARCKPPYDGLRDEPVYAVRRFWNTYLPSASSEGNDDDDTVMNFLNYRDIILTGSEWLRTQGSLITKGRITAPNELMAIHKSLHALGPSKD